MADPLDLTLDRAAPEEVGPTLRRAAQLYYEAQGELEASWGEKIPDIWVKLARILERAADQADKVEREWARRGYR